jgi:translocation and assembly module TamA
LAGPRTTPALAALVLLAASSLGGGCFLWKQPAGTAERPTILDFDIDGTHAVSAKDLREHLVTQPSDRRAFIIPVPSHFDDDAFENDKRRIVRYYQERGYYQAKVEAADVVPRGEGRVDVHVRVSEGPPVRVERIEILGLESAPEARERLKRLPLRERDVFTEAAYDATRVALQSALTETGWAHAQVSSQAQVDPERNLVRGTYPAAPGERYRFGAVFVAGAAAIPRARIRQEAELSAKPGATFDSSKVAQAQRRVFDLGVFGGVRTTPGPPDEAKKTIPTVVSVRESPFRTVRAGPGFTFQGNTRWEVDAEAGWAHRNWLGGLRKLSLDLRAGYAWLPTAFNAQSRGIVGLFSADFTQPELFTHYLDLNVHGELERGRELAYDYYAERLRLGLPFRLGRVLSFVPSLNFELYEIGGQIGTPDPSTGQQLTLSTCPGHDPNLCLLSYFEQRIGIDLRDDPINTTQGLYLGLSVQEGFSAFGNGAAYLRFMPEARFFLSPYPDVVLAGRLRLGIIDAPGGTLLPLVALFTSGGPNAMRGYYTRPLSPAVYACTSPIVGSGGAITGCSNFGYVSVGGAGLVDGGVELRFPVAGALGGAAFLDFGNVTYTARDAL